MEKAEIVQAYPVQNLLLFRGKYLELLLPVAFPWKTGNVQPYIYCLVLLNKRLEWGGVQLRTLI